MSGILRPFQIVFPVDRCEYGPIESISPTWAALGPLVRIFRHRTAMPSCEVGWLANVRVSFIGSRGEVGRACVRRCGEGGCGMEERKKCERGVGILGVGRASERREG